ERAHDAESEAGGPLDVLRVLGEETVDRGANRSVAEEADPDLDGLTRQSEPRSRAASMPAAPCPRARSRAPLLLPVAPGAAALRRPSRRSTRERTSRTGSPRGARASARARGRPRLSARG